MRIDINLFISVSISVIAVFTTSCTKEQGCTDPDSINYSASADFDNGSCRYEGSAVFWYNASTSDRLINDGAISLIYFVDDEIAGSSASNVYWTGAPDCGQGGSISINKDLGRVKTETYSYRVEDQTGWVFWSGTIKIYANRCTPYELSGSNRLKK